MRCRCGLPRRPGTRSCEWRASWRDPTGSPPRRRRRSCSTRSPPVERSCPRTPGSSAARRSSAGSCLREPRSGRAVEVGPSVDASPAGKPLRTASISADEMFQQMMWSSPIGRAAYFQGLPDLCRFPTLSTAVLSPKRADGVRTLATVEFIRPSAEAAVVGRTWLAPGFSLGAFDHEICPRLLSCSLGRTSRVAQKFAFS